MTLHPQKFINCFKSSRKLLLSFTLVFLSLFCSTSYAAGFVQTQGTQLVDEDGKKLFFSGINLGNWLLWEGYLMMGDFNYRTHTQFLNELEEAFGSKAKALEFQHQWRLNYVNEQAIIDLKALGFNSVRVPFSYKLFWQNNALANDGFEYFDRLIEWCKKHDMYILLDMHAAPGYQNPGDHSDNVDSNASQPRDTASFGMVSRTLILRAKCGDPLQRAIKMNPLSGDTT